MNHLSVYNLPDVACVPVKTEDGAVVIRPFNKFVNDILTIDRPLANSGRSTDTPGESDCQFVWQLKVKFTE